MRKKHNDWLKKTLNTLVQVQAGHLPASEPVREKPPWQLLTQWATFVQYFINMEIVLYEPTSSVKQTVQDEEDFMKITSKPMADNGPPSWYRTVWPTDMGDLDQGYWAMGSFHRDSLRTWLVRWYHVSYCTGSTDRLVASHTCTPMLGSWD